MRELSEVEFDAITNSAVKEMLDRYRMMDSGDIQSVGVFISQFLRPKLVSCLKWDEKDHLG